MQSLAMQKREMAEKARDELKFCYDGLALPSTATFEEAEAVCRQNLQNWDASKFDGSSRRSAIAEQKRIRFEDILRRLEIAREAQSSLGEAIKSNSEKSKPAEIEAQKKDLISEAPADDPLHQQQDASEKETESELEVDSETASTEAEESAIGHNRFRRRLEERRERYQKSQSSSPEISTRSEAEQKQIAEPGAIGIELGISESESESESVIETKQQSEIPEISTEAIDGAEPHETESPSEENTEAGIVLTSLEEAVEIEPVAVVAVESEIESTHEIAALDLTQVSDSKSNLSDIAEISEGHSRAHSHSSVDSDSNSDTDTAPGVSDDIQSGPPLITEGAESESLIFESSSNATPDDQEDNEDGPVFSSENETQEDSLFERAILNLHSQKVQIDQTEEIAPTSKSEEPALQQEPEIFEFFQKQEEIPSELGNIFDSPSENPSEEATSVFAEDPYSQDEVKTPALDPALFGGFEMEYAPAAGHVGEELEEEYLEESITEASEKGVPAAEFEDQQETDGFAWSEDTQQITDEEDQLFEADALTDPQAAHTEIQESEWEATHLEAGTEVAQEPTEEHHYDNSFDAHQEQLGSVEAEIAWESPEAYQQEQNIEGDPLASDELQPEDQWTEDDYLASDDEDQNWIEENPEAAGEVYYEDEIDPVAHQGQDSEAIVQETEYDEFQEGEEVAYGDEYTEDGQYDSYAEEDFDEPSADDLSESQELENEDGDDQISLETTFARGNHERAVAALASDEDFDSDAEFEDDDLDDDDLEGILGRPKRLQSRIITVVGVLMIFLILGGAVAGYFYFSNKNPEIEALLAEESAVGESTLNSDTASASNNSIFSSDAASSDPTDLLRDTPGSVTSNTTAAANIKKSSSNASPQMSANEAFSLGQELEMSGTPADMAKALDAYLIAGEQGMASAQLRLGIFYFEGLSGGAPDYTKASEWYLKAAERGRPEAQFYLACMALQNIGPKNELNNPAHWLREASDQQYSNAQVNLALLYLDGAGSITRDPNIAAMLLRQAAEQGNPLGQALLGMLYDRGESVEEDPVQAERWYRKAVERDPLENPMDVPGLPPVTRQTSWEILRHAQKVLATKILETTGVNNSNQIEEAKKLLESAAETNDPQAQFNLGLLYCDSSLSETDYSQAKKWFQEAASSNYPPAWVNLGWMYENGYGVEKDVKKAEENYINAVNSGDALAQYRLGLLYLYEGDKSSGDEIKAYHWIKTAASNGVPEAATKLQEWEQELSAKGANLSTSAVEAWRILDSLTELEIQSDPNSQALELENNNSSLSGFSIVSVFKLL